MKNIEEFSGEKKVQKNGPAGRKRYDRKGNGTRQKNKRGDRKWNQMTALWFQTGGRHQTSPASVTRERISRILELREILLSFQTFSTLSMLLLPVLSWRVFRAWNPHQVLEACDSLKLLSIHFDLCVDAIGVVISLVFSALISMS